MTLLVPILSLLLQPSASVAFRASEITFAEVPGGLLFGDLDGDGRAEVMVISPKRQLDVFQQRPRGSFPSKPDFHVPLRNDTWAVCIGDVLPAEGSEVLQLATPGVFATNRHGTQGVTATSLLVSLDSRLPHDPSSGVVKWPFAKDVDGDGRCELVVPAPPNVMIFRRTDSGRFSLAHTLVTSSSQKETLRGSLPGRRLIGHRSRDRVTMRLQLKVDVGAVEVLDHNRDGRLDIAIGDEVFLSNPTGGYDRADIECDGGYWLPDIDGDGQFDETTPSYRHTLAQVPVTTLRLTLKSGDDATKAKYRVRLRGIPYWRRAFVDVNGDRKMDLVMLVPLTKSYSIGSLVERAFVSGFEYELRFYLFDDKKGYAPKPHFAKTFRVKLSEGIGAFPQADVTQDLNGDGLTDVFVQRRTTLDVSYVRSITAGYSDKPDAVLPLPKNVDGIVWQDLNADGVKDAVVGSDRRRRFTLYVSGR